MLLVAVLAALALAGCENGDIKPATGPVTPIRRNPANADVNLTIGGKNFTEQEILAQIYSQGLRAAGYNVTIDTGFEDENAALSALKDGKISGYGEYVGTALLSFFDTQATDMPHTQDKAYKLAVTDFGEIGIDAFAPTPFSNSNALAMTKARAKELHVSRIDQLTGKQGQLTMAGAPECKFRADCLKGLSDEYALDFNKFLPTPPVDRHEVLLDGSADVSVVYETDPQIIRDRLKVLDDSAGIFPPDNVTFITLDETNEKAGPDYRKTIEAVGSRLTTPKMRALNAQVDFDKKSPAVVAAGYLRSEGFVQ